MVSVIEILIMTLAFGGPLHQMMGLPPGERDQNLVQAADQDSLLYIEWSARAEGKPNAKGIDGMAADSEIVQLFTRLKTAIQEGLVRDSGIEDLKILPELVVQLSGRPGCLFAGLDDEDALDPDAPLPFQLMQVARGGLVINGGDDADEMATSIQKLLSMAFREDVTSLQNFVLPAPMPLEIHRHDNYLILGVGHDSVTEIVNRLNDKSGGLGDSAGFQEGWSTLKQKRTASVSYLNVASTLSKIGNMFGLAGQIQDAFTLAGVEELDWMMGVVGVNEQGEVVTNVKIHGLSGNQGAMALFSGPGITKEDFAMVPVQSDIVVAASVDPIAIKEAVFEVVGHFDEGDQERLEQAYIQSGMMIGLNWEQDVIDVFGDTLVFSNSPSDGGFLGSGVVMTAKFENKQAAGATLEKLAKALEENLPKDLGNQWRRRGIEVVRSDFQGTEIFMINTIGNDDVPLAPSWCLTETHLLVGLHPQTLKSRLRSLQSDDWKSFEGKFNDAPEGDVLVFSYLRSEELIPKFYALLPWLGQIFFSEMQSEGIELNLLDLPSAAAVLPYMSDGKAFVVRTEDGIIQSSKGPALIGAMGASAPAIVPTLVLFGM